MKTKLWSERCPDCGHYGYSNCKCVKKPTAEQRLAAFNRAIKKTTEFFDGKTTGSQKKERVRRI